jgi:hypothetical protein
MYLFEREKPIYPIREADMISIADGAEEEWAASPTLSARFLPFAGLEA